jgi:hypothetical protein
MAPSPAPVVERDGYLYFKSTEDEFPGYLFYRSVLFQFISYATQPENHFQYIRNAKNQDVALHNTAWAAATGKGLLFRVAGDFPYHHIIINLAETENLIRLGVTKVSFVASGYICKFRAESRAEAEHWVSLLKVKIKDAKESKDTIVNSEAYKGAMEVLADRPWDRGFHFF